ncbi:MAG: hypothetical protein AAB508_01865, partial [Patescibacteria group bacterium]
MSLEQQHNGLFLAPDGVPSGGDSTGVSEAKKFTIHQLPWPVIDTGFTNHVELSHALPDDTTGIGTFSQIFLQQAGIWEISVPATTLPKPDASSLSAILRDGNLKHTFAMNEERDGWIVNWVQKNEAVIQRLIPENTYKDFPWEVLWTIRAVEQGKVLELTDEHRHAFGAVLGSIAGINMTPGIIGPPNIGVTIEQNGIATIVVNGADSRGNPLINRWIGQGQKNIIALATKYGYSVRLQDEKKITSLVCRPPIEGTIRKYIPAKPGQKFGYGFISRKNGSDVWVRGDALNEMITRYKEQGMIGKKVVFCEIKDERDDRSKAIGLTDADDEGYMTREAAKLALSQRSLVDEKQRDMSALQSRLTSIKEFLEPKTMGEWELNDVVLPGCTVSRRIVIEPRTFDPLHGATVTVRRTDYLSYRKAGDMIVEEYEQTGWEHVTCSYAGSDSFLPSNYLSRDKHGITVHFTVGSKDKEKRYSDTFPVTR